MNKGFTLIEVLVVVLIIAVLAAVALPQYQKAVLKSRFTAMMPIGQTLANSNEAYYLEHGEYANNPQELPVQGQSEYPDGTAILLYTNPEELSFVRVRNEHVPNAQYVLYQNHSKNFPNTTWCEAGDTRAEALCTALGGVIPTGLTGNSSGEDGWKAYLLTGQTREGDSFSSGGCSGEKPNNITASESGSTGKAKCVNGEWKYEWTVGNTYNEEHVAENPYAYAGSIFGDAPCIGLAEGACTGSTFVNGSTCVAAEEGIKACADSTFNGNSRCEGYTENGCVNSMLTDSSTCLGNCSTSQFSGSSSCDWGYSDCTSSKFSDSSVCESGDCSQSTFGDSSKCNGGYCGASIFSDSSSCINYSDCSESTFSGSSSCSDRSHCERSVFNSTSCSGAICDGSTFSGSASCGSGSICYESTFNGSASCGAGAECHASTFRDNAICSGAGCDVETTYEGNACCTTGGDCPPCS